MPSFGRASTVGWLQSRDRAGRGLEAWSPRPSSRAWSLPVTTTWRSCVVPCGHFAYSVLIGLDAVDLVGERRHVGRSPMWRWSAGDASTSRNTTAPMASGIRAGCMTAGDEARPEAAALLPLATEVRHAADGSTPSPEDRQRRRQEGQAADDRHEDRRRSCPSPSTGRSTSSMHEQAGERDHHREPAEEHGAAGGAARDLDRVELVPAVPPLGPEARDHEQRVVDRDGEPDQDDQLGRVRADRARRPGCTPRTCRTPPAAR